VESWCFIACGQLLYFICQLFLKDLFASTPSGVFAVWNYKRKPRRLYLDDIHCCSCKTWVLTPGYVSKAKRVHTLSALHFRCKTEPSAAPSNLCHHLGIQNWFRKKPKHPNQEATMQKIFKMRALWQQDSLRKSASMDGGELTSKLLAILRNSSSA